MNKRQRDLYGGLLIAIVGIGAALKGLRYPIGDLTRMGPGFFPIALGCTLALVGLAIALAAMREVSAEPPVRAAQFNLRGWVCVVASIIVFIFLANRTGLALATFATVFLAALGDRQAKLKASLALATAMTIFAALLFHYGLQLQIPLFRGLG